MKQQLAMLFFSLALALAPEGVFAKGKTVKVVVEGADLAVPVEMTEPGIEVFGVWEGPGVHAEHVDQKEGFIIDWRRGAVFERPMGLPQYEVSFYADFGSEVRLVYKVFYQYDPSKQEGFVYLPVTQLNTGSIYRGVEGNWFRATADWEEAVRQALSRTTAGSPGA